MYVNNFISLNASERLYGGSRTIIRCNDQNNDCCTIHSNLQATIDKSVIRDDRVLLGKEKGGVLDYHSIGLTTLLELTRPVSLKGSISIIGEEEARISIMNSLGRIICFGNKITDTYKSVTSMIMNYSTSCRPNPPVFESLFAFSYITY